MLRRAAVAHRLRILRQPIRFTRRYATKPDPTSPRPSRMARLEAHLPRFLQHIVTPLRSAPVSHITAFLVLHEITAIVPLFGLAATFHYANWLPPLLTEGKWVHEGTERMGKWLKKRGWITEDERSGRWWGRGEGGVRLVVEFGAAYAVTKALLPLRLVVSVWATPWFARWSVLPLANFVGKVVWRRGAAGGKGAAKVKVTAPSAAAGTGAVGAGVVPKDSGTEFKAKIKIK